MTAIIAYIPLFIAAYIALTQSVARAFIQVYIPVVLLLPTYYDFDAPLIPPVNFNQSAMLAIFFIWVGQGGFARWRFSFMDILVFAYVLIISISEYTNSGYKEAQNLIFLMFTAGLMPYLVAKGLIEQENLRIEIAKKIVFCCCIVAILSIPQFLLGGIPLWQRAFSSFFPGQGWEWIVQTRWGLTRITGPYAHAILAGIIMAFAYRLHRWLEWSNAWEGERWFGFQLDKQFKLSKFRFNFSFFIGLLLLLGLIMTLSRGPWIGAILSTFIVLIGRYKQRWLVFNGLLICAAVIIPYIVAQFLLFTESSDRQYAKEDHTEQTLVYRQQLMSTYAELASEKLWLGWGRTKRPRVAGQKSVDNHYLFMLLVHGIFIPSLLLIMMLWGAARLFFNDMLKPLPPLSGSGLGLTLASLYIMYGWTIATVFMGENTLPLFFILVGWTESYLLFNNRPSLQGEENTTPAITPPPFRFKRVLR